jgi:murein DD-endopeptidase MepM/ murein hydrolase activator NlpD
MASFHRPTLSPFANSDATLSLVIGKGPLPRIIHLRPWAALIGGTLAVLLLTWYLVATVYIVFKDEMLNRLMNQQAEMQYAYEDRLAALRNQIDKVTSRQVIDQNSLDGKLHELLSRQAQLETRHAVVATLAEQSGLSAPRPVLRQSTRTMDPRTADPLTTGSVTSYAPVGTERASKPSPAFEPFELRNLPQPDPRAVGGPAQRLNHSQLLDHSMSVAAGTAAALTIASARDLADRVENQQIAALDALEHKAKANSQRWSRIVAETGMPANRFVTDGKSAAQGGPLVPMSSRQGGLFEQKLSQTQFAIQQAQRIRKVVTALPIDRPLPVEHETTSTFGARTDPFTRSMAMHTGIDFRAPTGAAVRATGAGKVIDAGRMGGYGNMVEIDHGHGVTTRYAHLSSIGVDAGDTVTKGAIIGHVGSTGRSTGPHLHYETRIDGEATDPLRFMRAGQKHGGI